MKTLTMTTVRRFRNEREYEDYKASVKEFVRIDWKALEEDGSVSMDVHQPGEMVLTEFKLEDL